MSLGDNLILVRDTMKGTRASDDAILLAAAILVLADRVRDISEELPADD